MPSVPGRAEPVDRGDEPLLTRHAARVTHGWTPSRHRPFVMRTENGITQRDDRRREPANGGEINTHRQHDFQCNLRHYTKLAWLEKPGGGGGTRRDLPFRAPLIPFSEWDQGDPINNKNGPSTSLGLFFSNCNSCEGGFGPFETLGDPFPRGPPRPSLPTSGIISPALLNWHRVYNYTVGMYVCTGLTYISGRIVLPG